MLIEGAAYKLHVKIFFFFLWDWATLEMRAMFCKFPKVHAFYSAIDLKLKENINLYGKIHRRLSQNTTAWQNVFFEVILFNVYFSKVAGSAIIANILTLVILRLSSFSHWVISMQVSGLTSS